MEINAKTVTSVSIVIEMNSTERSSFDDLIWKLRNVILDSSSDGNDGFTISYTDKDNDKRTYNINREQADAFSKLYAVI